jgi:hypothetical protein
MPIRHHTFEHSIFVHKNKKEFPLIGQLGFQSMATPQGEAIVSFYHLVMTLMSCVLGFTF